MPRTTLPALLALVLLVPGLAIAGDDGRVVVPPDYARLVPSDAGVVIFIEDYGALRTAWNDMSIEAGGGSSPTMPSINRLIDNQGDTPLPANTPILAWTDRLDQILPNTKSGVLRVAFRMPDGAVITLRSKDEAPDNLTMHDGMAILSAIFPPGPGDVPAYTAPDAADNTLLTALPAGLVSIAVSGSDVGDLARGISPFASMAPMLMQESFRDRTRMMSKEDRKAVTKAQQNVIKDTSSLITSAVRGLEDVTLMTGSLTFDGDALVTDWNFSIGGEVAEDHGVDPRLFTRTPSGRTMYLALDAPTIRWLADFEMDVFEALFATSVASVTDIDALIEDVKAAGRMISGGYVLSTSNLVDAHTVIGTDRPDELVSAIAKVFDAMNDTDTGMTYRSTGENTWDFTMDTARIMKMLGLDAPKNEPGGPSESWTVTLTPGDRLVVTEQRAAAAEPAKVDENDGQVLAMLKALEESRIIVGLSLDGMGMLERTLEAQQTEMPALPPQLEKMNTDLSFVVHAPDPKTVSFHVRLPTGLIYGLSSLRR